VQALIHPKDTASRKGVEKLGVRRDCEMRDNLHVGDEWRNDSLYALRKTDHRNQA
jgi:hypothetical protein